MSTPSLPSHCAFVQQALLASGSLQEVAVAVSRVLAREPDASILVFDNATGQQVELDLRGDAAAVAARHAPAAAPADSAEAAGAAPAAKPRGRPRLGVVSREVTLLPEHWDWLGAQPGGASVALRKLVLQAMRAGAGAEAARRARERTYAFMSAMAGNLPGFEEATRALFAGDLERLAWLASTWPPDIRDHVARLAQPPAVDQPG